MVKILLINPPQYLNKIPVIREDRCEVTDRYAIIPPYSLLWLSSILREKGHEVNLIDANAAGISYEKLQFKIQNIQPDFLIFRFTPTTFEWDISTSKIAKEIDQNIITIGICLTLHTLINEVLKRASTIDIYIPIDWEFQVPKVIETIINNRKLSSLNGIGFHYQDEIIITDQENISTINIKLEENNVLPIPAFDLIEDFHYYRPNTPISGNFMVLYTSKGCPFQCTYCTVAKTPFRLKPAEKVIEELNILYSKYNVRLVSFFDETFTMDRARTIQICNEIRKSFPNLIWYCNTRVNLVDLELLTIMYTSGCRGIAFGVESGSQKILDNVKKGISVESAKNAILWAKKSGIKVYTSFIVGLPGENYDTIKETINFIRETLPHSAQINVAVPYPGTVLYKNCIEKGLITKTIDWTEMYQHKSTISLKDLPKEELDKARISIYHSLYFNPKWVLENIFWVIKHPEDFRLGVRYYYKILKNYFVYQMEHSH